MIRSIPMTPSAKSFIPSTMPPRVVRRLGELEKRLIWVYYRQEGPLWDLLVNDIRRDPNFLQLPVQVQELYREAANRSAVRRRVREFIQKEQRL